MRLSFVFCLIINLVASRRRHRYDCEDESSQSSEEGPDHIHKNTLKFRGKIRQLFAVEVGLEAREGNMICSPISAMMPLAKLVLGAKLKSKTEQELLAALGLRNTHELKKEYMQTLTELRYLTGVDISLASRTFVSKDHKLRSKFKHKSEKIFESAIESIDTTRREDVANEVNEWVALHTKNKITKLISPDEIDPNLSLLLVNAIYFKGSWRHAFKPATLQPFYSPGGMIHVPMMNVTGRFNYIESDDLNAKIIELPYNGQEAAMIIVLPNDRTGLPILLRAVKVSHDLLRCAINKMSFAKVTVTIPKFQIESTMDLKSYYKNMGISRSVSPELSELTEIVQHQNVFISKAVQKAIIEVTELGMVAAAASVIHMVLGTPFTVQTKEFKADHPFMFYIRARREQLFAGTVSVP